MGKVIFKSTSTLLKSLSLLDCPTVCNKSALKGHPAITQLWVMTGPSFSCLLYMLLQYIKLAFLTLPLLSTCSCMKLQQCCTATAGTLRIAIEYPGPSPKAELMMAVKASQCLASNIPSQAMALSLCVPVSA